MRQSHDLNADHQHPEHDQQHGTQHQEGIARGQQRQRYKDSPAQHENTDMGGSNVNADSVGATFSITTNR